MLKLHIFAVCDRVILDVNNTASLISLFDEVHARLPKGADKVPPDAVAPREWSIFTSWQHGDEDASREYNQVIQITYPDGSVFKEHAQRFSVAAGKVRHQITLNLMGFPIGQQGTYKIALRLESEGATLLQSDPIKIRVQHDRS